MQGAQELVAFLGTVQPQAARRFYEQILGLELLEDTPLALVLRSGANRLRLQKVAQVTPPPYTALGWSVDDIAAELRALAGHGVMAERFDGLEQDELGIWQSPGPARIAWFRDPDGHLLSFAEGD